MSRQVCSQCHFPQTVCLCEWIRPVDNLTRILVLQHPSEVNQSKNTVRLMQLCLTNFSVFVGESEEDFIAARTSIEQKGETTAVIYPNHQSSELITTADNPFKQLVLIDGTWRKAYKIWQLNPWLHQYPSFHFGDIPQSIYQRKAKFEQSLSTLEACHTGLKYFEQTDTSPLLELLQQRQRMGF